MTLNKTLLPPNSTSEEVGIDQAMAGKLAFDLTPVDTHPLTCQPSFLPWLAAAMRVDINGLGENEQRNMIANARNIHRHKGTVGAAQRALNSVFQNAQITMFDESFVFNASVSFGADTTAVYDQAKFDTAKKLVNDAKNLGSRFGSFTVDMPDSHVPINHNTQGVINPVLSQGLELQAQTNINFTGHAQWIV